MNHRITSVVIAAMSVFVTACGDENVDDAMVDMDFDVGLQAASWDPPPEGDNGDDPHWLWTPETLSALEQIANVALTSGPAGNLPSLPNLSADERKIIASAMKCALDDGSSARDSDTGEEYKGWWGLAPDWQYQPLTLTERAWVSACMIQKLNAYTKPVPILFEGPRDGIETKAALNQRYPYREATAWGDLFTGAAGARALVCLENDTALACGNPAAAMQSRICDTVGAACNLTIVGNCSDACVLIKDDGPDTGYWMCQGWMETIRVRLKTSDASCYGTSLRN